MIDLQIGSKRPKGVKKYRGQIAITDKIKQILEQYKMGNLYIGDAVGMIKNGIYREMMRRGKKS